MMRLWHWKLIPVLPRQQLLGQWRECCAIAKSISETGTPNHILVNPIMNYSLDHFLTYCCEVADEMEKRGYNADLSNIGKHFKPYSFYISPEDLFKDWHNDQYLMQCYYNLQEKHDRGGISDEEWQKIQEVVHPNQILETLEELHKQQLFNAIGEQYRLSNGISF